MLLMRSVALPVLVKVTLCDALDVPTAWLPNERLVADNDTVPVPVSAIDCGEPVALSVIVTAAVTAPAAVGAKCPWMVQFAPTAMIDPQLLANTNEEAFAPVTAMLEMVTVELLVFLRVTL